MQNGGLGGGAGGTQKVNVVLPTFPPDEDYDDEEEEDSSPLTVDLDTRIGKDSTTSSVCTSSPEVVVDSNTISNDVGLDPKSSADNDLA